MALVVSTTFITISCNIIQNVSAGPVNRGPRGKWPLIYGEIKRDNILLISHPRHTVNNHSIHTNQAATVT